jgi:hypothetical protein
MTDNNTLADNDIKDFDRPSRFVFCDICTFDGYPFENANKHFENNNKRTLKLTEYKKTWIRNQVIKYALQIGITEQEIPNLVFSRKGVLAMPKHLTEGRRTVSHKYKGICFREAKTIFIHVKKHTSSKELRHTIVHELVHYRFPYLKHGIRFEKRISLILKGKRYGSKLLYIEKTPSSLLPHSQDHENQLHIRTDHCIVNPKITATDERGS